jgi:glucokinase
MTIQAQSFLSTPPGVLMFKRPPRLLADIGGTNARFALETAPGRFEAI